MIKLQQITKQFQSGNDLVTALNGVDLEVKKGEIFGIIGESGAGKSTLIRCVNLLERPTSGKVIVDGVDLLSLSNKKLTLVRRNIGMIFQHFNLLLQKDVYHNIALPLLLSGTPKQEIDTRVNELLKLVKLEKHIHQYPSELSGGQKQRVAIARALATNPKVLLCDEATSALDPGTTEKILKLLTQINRELGVTILLITHEMNVIKSICDRVAVIDNGNLIEQGTVENIFASPQTKLAQDFIDQTAKSKLPDYYTSSLVAEPQPGYVPVVSLKFTGESVDAPVLSQISRNHKVDFSILESHIDFIKDTKFGFLICEICGNKEDIAEAFKALEDHRVGTKLLGYINNTVETKGENHVS